MSNRINIHHRYFNPRSLAGATQYGDTTLLPDYISIHAPSRERPYSPVATKRQAGISIHAPSRERLTSSIRVHRNKIFQSTLPRGSDVVYCSQVLYTGYFNPRSLAGATISLSRHNNITLIFQSTLPRGSDGFYFVVPHLAKQISIHAPSRERRVAKRQNSTGFKVFQSTLPRGSDSIFSIACSPK